MAAGAGSTVLKRLAWLNRSGVLTKPLQYSQVKAVLEGAGEERALQILKDLEEEAASVPDPVEYVKTAAEAPPAAGGTKRKATDEAEPEGIVAKRVRLLNGSGQLSQPIAYGRVREALDSLGVAQAMTILKGLEDVAGDVADPTGYIRTAVRGAGGLVAEEEPEAEGEAEEAAEGMAVDGEGEAPPAPTRGGWAKSEPTDGRALWAKGEELTDTEKIERRVRWLNRNGGLTQELDLEEVMPALDCIGLRHSMRVLRRLEEAAGEATDPTDFVKDQVARSGWIWGKPDAIDDDEKVAKRVAWLNLFGGLMQPIDYAQVADPLDGLKVAHAMVLLRELEVQAHKVEDPTEHIKRTVGLAGEDEVHVPVVDEDSSVGQHVAQLNQAGSLAKPIDFTAVGEDLARLGDEGAMQLLQEVEEKGRSVKDPTGYIRFKLKAKLAAMGTSLEEPADEETRILKRVEWLNDYGGLLQDIDYNQVAAALQAAGVEHAMTVLKELEDKRSGVQDPNAFILAAVGSARRRATPAQPPRARARAPAPAPAPVPAGRAPVPNLKTIAGFVALLNKNPKVKKPVKFSEVAQALNSLGPRKALQVLREMQERGLGLDDPVTYIRAAAQRSSLRAVKTEVAEDDGDDVAKITKRLKWLNQFGGLAKKINSDEVVGALYCLGLPQTMAILRGLQEKGGRVPDPTWYIKAAIQRANGIRVAPQAPEPEEEEPGEEAEAEAEAEAEEPEEEEEDGAIEDFEEPEGDGEEAAEGGVEEDGYGYGEEAAEDEGAEGAEEPEDGEELKQPPPVAMKPAKPAAVANKPKPGAERRVVGGLTGYNKLVPTRPAYGAAAGGPQVVKSEPTEEPESKPEEAPKPAAPTGPVTMPITPQEKLVQVRNLAMKHGLQLDQLCLKSLARLPFYKAKDMIDDVLLGGRNRKGVSNPSRYLTIGVQKMSTGLGVEQGLAMELAVSLGVVLNNDALDELACIPRKESHGIIREIARNDEARADPIRFIQAEVMKCRAQLDARPWGK